MSKVSFNMTVSLDGFVAGPNDEVDKIFAWYSSGDTELLFPGAPYPFKISQASAERLKRAGETIGAVVTGRRNFDLAGAWGGHPPLGVPHVVLTHHAPAEWTHPDSPYTFVADGIESAIAAARKLAGGKDVTLSTPSVLQQALRAGLVDEIDLDLAHVLLGAGVRLFDNLGDRPVDLEQVAVVEGIGVTHLTFRVVK